MPFHIIIESQVSCNMPAREIHKVNLGGKKHFLCASNFNYLRLKYPSPKKTADRHTSIVATQLSLLLRS